MSNLGEFLIWGGSLLALALSWLALLRWVWRDCTQRNLTRTARLGWAILVVLSWVLGGMVYLLARAERSDALSDTPYKPGLTTADETPSGVQEQVTQPPPMPSGEMTVIPLSEYQLSAIAGSGPSSAYRLGHGFNLLGREPEAEEGAYTVKITGDPSISRNHLVLECSDNRLTIRDISSQHSSWLNGKRLVGDRQLTISEDDELRLGSTLFRLEQTRLQAHGGPATPVPQPIFQLRGSHGQAASLVRPLNGSRLIIGRSADCDLVLDDEQISRHHAELYLDQAGYRLSDSGSSNGSFVNQRRIKDKALTPGDVIQMGSCCLVFEEASFEV